MEHKALATRLEEEFGKINDQELEIVGAMVAAARVYTMMMTVLQEDGLSRAESFKIVHFHMKRGAES